MSTAANLSAGEIADEVAAGRLAATAAVGDALAAVANREARLHAWQELDAVGARASAAALDAARIAGEPVGPLAGVPLGVKDNLDVAGLPTRCGSSITADTPATRDAPVVARARAAGAVILGKTVLTEFAYFQPGATVNPWHAGHTPGGSSSGSAAAVASGMVPLAFGTQTAGSVIRPAAFCGVFGFKPASDNRGLAGARPFAASLDTIGWFARAADDLERLRAVLSDEPVRVLPRLDPAGLRLGFWNAAEWGALDSNGAPAWRAALRSLADAGFGTTQTPPPTDVIDAIEAQQLVMAFEGRRAFQLELQHHRERLSLPLRTFVEAASSISEADHRAALAAAEAARASVDGWLQTHDAMLVPSAPGSAPAGLGATGDPVFCRVWTLLGLPCVNVPGLRDGAGLPVGLQLVGRRSDERRLLAVADAVFRTLADATGRAGESAARIAPPLPA